MSKRMERLEKELDSMAGIEYYRKDSNYRIAKAKEERDERKHV